jgi:hypothetical protein
MAPVTVIAVTDIDTKAAASAARDLLMPLSPITVYAA